MSINKTFQHHSWVCLYPSSWYCQQLIDRTVSWYKASFIIRHWQSQTQIWTVYTCWEMQKHQSENPKSTGDTTRQCIRYVVHVEITGGGCISLLTPYTNDKDIIWHNTSLEKAKFRNQNTVSTKCSFLLYYYQAPLPKYPRLYPLKLGDHLKWLKSLFIWLRVHGQCI